MDKLDSLPEMKNLSAGEKAEVMRILNEMKTSGKSDTLDRLKYADYWERPVGIDEFLDSDAYLAKGLNVVDEASGTKKQTVFPYWRKTLRKIFPDNLNTSYNTVILSGAIGIGKSFMAVICLLYMLYRMMCLKDPYKHYGLQPIDHITFSFMNITLDAAKGVAWSKFQELLKASPWFMAHGTLSKSEPPEWRPNSNIELLYGSQPSHVIGRAVFANFCLDGDTVISTADGDRKLKELVGKDIRVKTLCPSGRIVCSEYCTVRPTVATKCEYRVRTADGSVIRCTPNHRFMLEDGSYKEARYLSAQDVLMGAVSGKTARMPVIGAEEAWLDAPNQYYDVINAKPYDNFLIRTSGGYVVSHNCDEISFMPNKDVTVQIDKAKQLINSIDARMQSRFMKGEKMPTLQILASSKRTDQSFLETYIDMKRKNESKTTLIVDEPQWVIRTDKDSDRKFWVAIGNKFLDSELIPLGSTESDLDCYRKRGYSLMQVPMGYYEQFKDDIDIALTDIAGISTTNAMSYISGVRWNESVDDRLTNPFMKEILTVGDGQDDNFQYSDFFDLGKVPAEYKSRPMYIHLDMSISGDKTGIAGVWIIGKKPPEEGKPESKELYYQTAFAVSIKAPKGRQVSFDKNCQFIYWLRDNGFNVKTVSSDTFQNAAVGQQLQAHHFDYKVISVDRLDNGICPPYQILKSTIYEGRIKTFPDRQLTDEIIGLVRDGNGKIDHSPAGINCLSGDTKVSLLDGREVSMKDLVNEFDSGKTNWVYSVNEATGTIEPQPIEKAWCSGRNASLMEVVLDNGEIIRCTPEHRFMLRNGSYIEACNLIPNDSLMPLYRKVSSKGLDGYRLYYEPIEDKWHYEHRRFAKDVLDAKHLVHHHNCNKLDNTPGHDDRISSTLSEKHREGYFINADASLKRNNIKRKNLKKMFPAIDREDFDKTFGMNWEDIPRGQRGVWANRYREHLYQLKNHRVVSVRYLDKKEDVYDITVRTNHNFALSSGIFVHNSKDCADAVCGALFSASQHGEEYAYDYGENIESTIDANSDSPMSSVKKQMTVDMESELNQAFDPIAKLKSRKEEEESQESRRVPTDDAEARKAQKKKEDTDDAMSAYYASNGILLF